MRCLIFLLCCFSSALFGAEKALDLEEVIATVNGISITRGKLEKEYSQNRFFVSSEVVTRERTLNNLINRIVGIQAAKAENLQNNPTVKRKMEDVLYHAYISRDLGPKFKKIEVTERDVKRYYRNNPEYRTAHILLRVRANPEEKEWQAALLQAKKIYISVRERPKRFAEYANQYGQSNNALQGGDMGFQPAQSLAPEYFRAIKGKSIGHITPPVRTQYGYHIIKVMGVKKYSQINQPLYKKLSYNVARNKILDDYFAKKRKKAKVKIHVKLD